MCVCLCVCVPPSFFDTTVGKDTTFVTHIRIDMGLILIFDYIKNTLTNCIHTATKVISLESLFLRACIKYKGVHICLHTHTHTHTHTRTHARTHARTNAHTHTHTQIYDIYIHIIDCAITFEHTVSCMVIMECNIINQKTVTIMWQRFLFRGIS